MHLTRRAAAAASLAILTMLPSGGQAHEQIVATIPIQLIGNHIFTEARINGNGPYRFVVDTGGVNLVTPALQKSLDLPALGSETGHGIGAKSVDSGITLVRALTINGHTFENMKFFTYDLDQLYASGGVHMQGMIGIDVFRHVVTRINFASGKIDLIDPRSFNASASGDAIPLTIKDNELSIPASFDGIKGKFQIDTGSGSTLTLHSPFVAAHNLTMRFPGGLRTVGHGVGGGTHEITVRGRDLKIGNQTIAHPVTQLSIDTTGNFARTDLSGNIGLGALKRFVVTFDFDNKRMYLKPSPVADTDTYDRSGLSLKVAGDGFHVTNVIVHSPADEAGIHAGDVIQSVNGKPAATFSLADIRGMLRLKPAGTVMALGIKTPHGTKTVRITLRDLM